MSEDRKAPKARGGNPPIAWHPLFPAMVAVWFGALFGLGALAVRVSLLERLAVASGIDLLVPAAAPPLGMTARILIALGLALVGGVLGAVIGKLMARSKPSAVARRAEAAAAKAAPADIAEAAPAEPRVPIEAPSFIDISQLDLDPEIRFDEATAGTAAIEPAAVEIPTEPARDEPARESQPVRRADPAYFPLPATSPVPVGAAAQRLIAADLDDLSHLELIERLALSLQKRRQESPVYLDAGSAEALAAAPAAEIVVEAAPPAPQHVPAYYPSAPESAAPRLAAVAEEEDAEDENDETAEGTYRSLLGIGRPTEARPVALFPEAPAPAPDAAARQDSDPTERALRDALAALQRMSGAA